MPNHAALLALAARVESAEGACRELDGAIWCAVNGYDFLGWDGAGVMWRGSNGDRSHYTADRVRRFTASLDAALTLVPGEWTAWEIRSRGGKTRFVAELSRVPAPGGAEQLITSHSSATPALALTAACLRARAAMEAGDG